MKNRTRILVLVAIVVLIGVVLLVRSAVSSRSNNDAEAGESSLAANSESLGGASQIAKAGFLSVATIESAADRVASQIGSGNRAALRDAVADTLLTWSSGSVDDWVAYLQAYNIDVPEIVYSDPATEKLMWSRSREFFRTARFDVSQLAVIREFDNPPPPGDDGWGGSEGPGFFTSRARRDAGRSFLKSIPERDRRVTRITIPGVFVTSSSHPIMPGVEYQAEFRLEFTYNPEAKQWVLTEYGMRGPDEGNGVPGMPSLPM